ncbi:MAG: hypothetical protein RJA22_2992 [Verrucomicrobiota bacterium]|jgi:hypothetical protein
MTRALWHGLAAGLWVALLAPSGLAQNTPPGGGGGGNRGRGQGGRGEVRMPTPAFQTDVPAHPGSFILGRPTRTNITLSVLRHQDQEGYIAWGTQPGTPTRQTSPRLFPKGQPVEVVLDGLAPGQRHYYEFRSRAPGSGSFQPGTEHSFTTARPPGATFTFTVQADPHLDYGVDVPAYRKSLTNVLAARSDFHLDLGDTFMTDKYGAFTNAAPQYLAQRYYFGLVGHSVPVFLVLGNHDGEMPGRGGTAPGSMTHWSNTMRKRYFPNPVPDGFYTGNATPDPQVGLPANYYAWEWGDALFLVLDPFWFSTRVRRGEGDNWSRTLGQAQYRWLQRTLESSRARHRFVFIHHLVGGDSPEGRGGAEASRFFEWGGHELDGRHTFAQRRPGWELPIHDLLVRHRVSAVFHGHDHIYAFQERDGLVYQLVPQPGHSRFDVTRNAADYGYRSGVIQGSAGILRVSVSPAEALVEYVRAYPDRAEAGGLKSGSVTHRYTLPGRDPAPAPR